MKTYQAGKKIRSLNELKRHDIVYVPDWNRTQPVAFFLAWQWRQIDNWVNDGRIYTAQKIRGINEKH